MLTKKSRSTFYNLTKLERLPRTHLTEHEGTIQPAKSLDNGKLTALLKLASQRGSGPPI